MGTLDTEILVIGSGAGGSTTAARLADAGRQVTVVEEGPWADAGAHEPFSLEEMVAKYRHRCIAGARQPQHRLRRGSVRRGSTWS